MHASESDRLGDVGWTKLNAVPSRVSSSRFVGRRAELTRLEESWKAAVADERAATVLLAGEAGVGKSRLVAELVARIPEPSLVLVGHAHNSLGATLADMGRRTTDSTSSTAPVSSHSRRGRGSTSRAPRSTKAARSKHWRARRRRW